MATYPPTEQAKDETHVSVIESTKTCLDEVQEVIGLKDVITSVTHDQIQESIQIEQMIVEDLRSYVMIISKMYHGNSFHNFEHACHVTMSVNKLLKRIVTPDLSENQLLQSNKDTDLLHNHLQRLTYGIYSDPIAQLAIVFSALIHDVDHRGCSNVRLAIEEPTIAKQYCNKSVAEQNSLDLAWELLMRTKFDRLRAVFRTSDNLLHFRHVIVNAVLATDIFDKELNDLRKSRWNHAFSNALDQGIDDKYSMDRKATIVIEHIIQASDVSHTMQHWQVYRKWNTHLFCEMSLAYQNGRMPVDPATFWYQGELNFFDSYIIPLAKKLKDCGVFGVSSDEYLNYAIGNREEWERRGQSIVEELVHCAKDVLREDDFEVTI
jgi:3'5'-cyclic nucleotide phosphodiesterase